MWKSGAAGVPRTGKPSLSDRELVVCDAIGIDPATPVGLLLHEDFQLAFNLPYGDMASVPVEVLDGMIRKGVVQEVAGAGTGMDAMVRVSDAGREAWSAERLPVWDAYCSGGLSVEPRVLRVRAVSEEVATAYVSAWLAATPSSLTLSDCRFRQETTKRFPYWREGPFVIVELHLPEAPNPTDLVVMQSRRTWWSTVAQLLESHGALVPTPRPAGALPALFRRP
jgi:hypothetical protein